jgi:hypothetical protein
MKRSSVVYVLIAICVQFVIFSMVSCNKEDEENATYREAAKDQASADVLFSDVFNQVNLAAGQLEYDLFGPGFIKSDEDGGCATITITPWDIFNWPKTLTIDFGDTNCQGVDGKYRRGMITAVLTGRYRDSLTTITISPEDYFVNEFKVEGLKTVTNLGHITDGKMTFAVIVQNALITNPDGEEFTWESERTRVWAEGEATAWPIVMDDVFEISGEATGTTYSNLNFFIQTTAPLRVERDCEWIVSGELQITPEGYATRTLNYGDGDCDNKASLSVNGVTIQITLP